MLVLSRKSNESVVVGGSSAFQRILKVTVLEISGGRVRLGFDVEADVPVHRMEVWARIQTREAPGGSRGPPASLTDGDALPFDRARSV
jgi:carbon storage regulator